MGKSVYISIISIAVSIISLMKTSCIISQ